MLLEDIGSPIVREIDDGVPGTSGAGGAVQLSWPSRTTKGAIVVRWEAG